MAIRSYHKGEWLLLCMPSRRSVALRRGRVVHRSGVRMFISRRLSPSGASKRVSGYAFELPLLRERRK